jgi:hypothetical protein
LLRNEKPKRALGRVSLEALNAIRRILDGQESEI